MDAATTAANRFARALRMLLRWIGYVCLAAIALLGALLLAVVVAVVVKDYRTALRDKSCVPADPVRVLLDGVEYRLPAPLQPFIAGETIYTRDTFATGVRTQEYCQPPDVAPEAIKSFSLDLRALSRVAAADARFARLAELHQVVLYKKPPPPLPNSELPGELVAEGRFRQIDHGSSRDLISTGPIFAGASVNASCGPAPTLTPSTLCIVYGRLPSGSRVRIMLLDTTHPLDVWPETFAQVEAFLNSMASGAAIPQ